MIAYIQPCILAKNGEMVKHAEGMEDIDFYLHRC